MHASVFAFIQWTWGITGIVWLAAALASKRSVRKQSAGSRIVHVAMMVLGFGLIFGDPLAVGNCLDQRGDEQRGLVAEDVRPQERASFGVGVELAETAVVL